MAAVTVEEVVTETVTHWVDECERRRCLGSTAGSTESDVDMRYFQLDGRLSRMRMTKRSSESPK